MDWVLLVGIVCIVLLFFLHHRELMIMKTRMIDMEAKLTAIHDHITLTDIAMHQQSTHTH